MKVLAAPSPTPAPTGRLREWNGGVPGHGEFVMLKTQPTDGSAPIEFSSTFGSRLWMSPDNELPPTVSGEACTLRQLIRQGDGKTRGVGLSGAVASLVVAVPRVTRQVTGRRVRAFGMNCLRVRGGAGLAPAAGLIRSLSAVLA
ncbi:MAG TPA: hypothetical protein VN960_00345 [Gaiellaceae bacterium]|nr:hypothetical protein [Gaiellaceae bacterium]